MYCYILLYDATTTVRTSISIPHIFACGFMVIGTWQMARSQQLEPASSKGTIAHLNGMDASYVHPVEFPSRRGITQRSVRPDLRHALQIWQNKLQLTEWRVTVAIVDDGALDGKAMGDIQWDLGAKRAAIRILREEDYDLPAEMARLDQQATILHELVHLRHASKRECQGADEASVINQTNALLRANRQWRILAVQEQ